MYDLWCLVPVHDSDNISPLLIDVFKYNIFFSSKLLTLFTSFSYIKCSDRLHLVYYWYRRGLDRKVVDSYVIVW
jgi:hypothetical protein